MIYEFVRPLTCPFEKIERYVPKAGNILDVGCGHGLLAKLLASKSARRQVLGIDPSYKKIELAGKNNSFKNLEFKVGFLANLKKKFDCIVIIDVLYLFPYEKKLDFFGSCFRLLKSGGKLILVENGNGKEFIFNILKIQENVMVKYLKFTHSEYKGIHFLGNRGYLKLLRKTGFKINLTKNLRSVLPYPHVMFVAKRP